MADYLRIIQMPDGPKMTPTPKQDPSKPGSEKDTASKPDQKSAQSTDHKKP